MIDIPVALSPAQIAFLQKHLPNFNTQWRVGIAAGAGSERRFLRVEDPISKKTSILIVWNSQDKDWPRFIGIQQELSDVLTLLPHVCAVDHCKSLILEEDFGSTTLNRFCVDHSGDLAAIQTAYRNSIDALIQWQEKAGVASESLRTRSMDFEMFQWESWYFATHCVAEYFGLEEMLDTSWETERTELARTVSSLPQVAIHRDFQSENIMISGQGIKFVDFQGARMGPAGYDLASLLYDPYIHFFTNEHVDGLVEWYNNHSPVRLDESAFNLCAVQRLMQALGAYGNLSLHKGKDRYQSFIPVALLRLRDILKKCPLLPVSGRVVSACIAALG